MGMGEEDRMDVTTESSVDSELSSRGSPVTDADGEVVSDVQPSSPAPMQASGPEWQGVVDYARSQGVELPYKDDAVALQQLLQAYRSSQERNYYSDFGRQMMPYADQIQAWISQNQQQRQQGPQRPSYAPPAWDPRWASMVERDPNTGALRSKAGYDPRIADAVQSYADWRDQFLEDPAKMIAPMVEERAAALIEQRFGQHQVVQQSEGIVSQNAGWIFQMDANGRPILDQYGSRQLSPAGQVYARAVKQLGDSGVKDVRQMDAYARSVVENMVLRQQYMQYQQQAASGQAAQQQGQVQPSVGGSATRYAPTLPKPKTSRQGLSLRESMDAALKGFADDEADLG